MDSENKNYRIFSANNIEVFIIRHTDKMGFIIMCVVFILVKFDIGTINIKNPDRILIVFSIIFFFSCLPNILLRKFAYKICFDLDKSEAIFFMNYPSIRKRTIIAKIEDIQRITLNFYITFEIDGKKVLYNGVKDNEMVSYLEKLKLVTWKKWGRKINASSSKSVDKM